MHLVVDFVAQEMKTRRVVPLQVEHFDENAEKKEATPQQQETRVAETVPRRASSV